MRIKTSSSSTSRRAWWCTRLPVTTGTLVNGLMYHCKDELSGINGVMRPGIVHRIDMDTTGVLIVCKNDKAHNAIAEQLKVHSITRKYYAIVHGVSSKRTMAR